LLVPSRVKDFSTSDLITYGSIAARRAAPSPAPIRICNSLARSGLHPHGCDNRRRPYEISLEKSLERTVFPNEVRRMRIQLLTRRAKKQNIAVSDDGLRRRDA